MATQRHQRVLLPDAPIDRASQRQPKPKTATVAAWPRSRTSTQGRASLADKAYETIKRKIITLEYRPGQYLNEATVCRLLKIGRTPVHQAMHRLMLDQLVEIIPRKGVIVRPDSLNEILELLEARWAVESYCTGLAVERASPRDVDDLERLLNAARQYLEASAIESFMKMDRAFHGRIAALGNSVLSETLRTLHERSARIWFLQVWTDEDFTSTQAEHEAVLAAIKRGNKEGAITAMQCHLTSLRRRIVRTPEE
jgi:DNA-binding GntR family transcriptional regulator